MVNACMSGIHDSEALVRAGASLVEIGNPFDLEVVADLLSTHATHIEKGAAVRIGGSGDPCEPSGISQGIGARNREQRVRVTIREGGVRDAKAAARRDRPADTQSLTGNPLHLRRMMHPPR